MQSVDLKLPKFTGRTNTSKFILLKNLPSTCLRAFSSGDSLVSVHSISGASVDDRRKQDNKHTSRNILRRGTVSIENGNFIKCPDTVIFYL